MSDDHYWAPTAGLEFFPTTCNLVEQLPFVILLLWN